MAPDIVLMVGIIIQFVGGLELLPHGRAPALEECVDGILVFSIHLQITCSMWTQSVFTTLFNTHVTFGKYLKVGHKVVPGSDVLQHCEYFTRVGPRLLSSAQYFLGSEYFFICRTIFLTCLRNWLQGKPKILKGLSAYRSVSALRA